MSAEANLVDSFPQLNKLDKRNTQRPLTGSLARRNIATLISDLLPLSDFFCLLGATVFSLFLYGHWVTSLGQDSAATNSIEHAAWVASALAPFVLYDKCFGSIARHGRAETLIRSFALRFATFVGVMLVLGVASESIEKLPLQWIAIFLGTAWLFTALVRVLIVQQVRRLQRRGKLTEMIAVVGTGPVADRLVRTLLQTSSSNIQVVGVFDDKIIGAAPCAVRSSGNIEKLIELSKSREIDWIILTLPPTAEQRLLSISQRLQSLSVPIGLCPQQVGLTVPYLAIDYVGSSVPVSLLADRPIRRWDAFTKQGEDFLLGSIAAVLLIPVFVLIGLAIKLNSPGPILFKQRRHAENNREFEIYKFRTMYWQPSDDTALQQTLREDTRVTRVGRLLRSTSLDELPQLFNVLQGDMSLVGPRPHAIDMRTEDQLGAEITDTYVHRHRVKPGITGWSQINGARGATDTKAQLQRRVELDLHYINHWSLWLDLKILVLTSRELIKSANAF